MENKKLEHWARALLDTGKRNNLVNFRETKSSSVEILIPSTEELFQRALAGAEFEVFENKSDRLIIPTDRETYLDTYAEKLRKKKQILIYSAKGDPAAAIKNIEKRTSRYAEKIWNAANKDNLVGNEPIWFSLMRIQTDGNGTYDPSTLEETPEIGRFNLKESEGWTRCFSNI